MRLRHYEVQPVIFAPLLHSELHAPTRRDYEVQPEGINQEVGQKIFYLLIFLRTNVLNFGNQQYLDNFV